MRHRSASASGCSSNSRGIQQRFCGIASIFKLMGHINIPPSQGGCLWLVLWVTAFSSSQGLDSKAIDMQGFSHLLREGEHPQAIWAQILLFEKELKNLNSLTGLKEKKSNREPQ